MLVSKIYKCDFGNIFWRNYYRFKIYFCSEGRYFIIDSDLQLLDKSLILETTTVTFDWGKKLIVSKDISMADDSFYFRCERRMVSIVHRWENCLHNFPEFFGIMVET